MGRLLADFPADEPRGRADYLGLMTETVGNTHEFEGQRCYTPRQQFGLLENSKVC